MISLTPESETVTVPILQISRGSVTPRARSTSKVGAQTKPRTLCLGLVGGPGSEQEAEEGRRLSHYSGAPRDPPVRAVLGQVKQRGAGLTGSLCSRGAVHRLREERP